jgi:hypothetical protein
MEPAAIVEDDYGDDGEESLALGQASGESYSTAADSPARPAPRFSFEDAVPRTERLKPGKKEHAIWTYFTKIDDPKTHPASRCKHANCGAEFNNSFPSGNLKKHLLEECPRMNEFAKDHVRSMFEKPGSRTTHAAPTHAPPSTT